MINYVFIKIVELYSFVGENFGLINLERIDKYFIKLL